MAELNLGQIEKKLNSEFESDSRVIIFWYDENKEFINDIEELSLNNAKKYYLTKDNLFKTKILLEREDLDSNYLIYAPFSKPRNEENHLTDIILYSKEFSADRLMVIMSDLKIDPKYRYILEKHINFFNAKDRYFRFSSFDIDDYNSEQILEQAILASLTKLRRVNFEEILRVVLSSGIRENEYLKEFRKYDLEEVFWKYIRQKFSYSDEDPTLVKFCLSLFITYLNSGLNANMPKNYEKYVLNKPGNVLAFLDSMMNNNRYIETFRKISDEVYSIIDGDKLLSNLKMEDIIDLDIFRSVDDYIIKWILEKLLDENLNVDIKGKNIVEICKNRKFKHYSDCYSDIYDMFLNGHYILENYDTNIKRDVEGIIKEYDKKYYMMDLSYRKFYYYLDRINGKYNFEKFESLIENIYINRYINVLSSNFNNALEYNELSNSYLMQKDFYHNFVENTNERVIVIISDAFRYELAKELLDKFNYNEKIEADLEYQIGVVPSYTSLGMAALLPNKNICFDEKYNVFVDGKPTNSLINRKEILQNKNKNSEAIQFNDLIKLKKQEMREIFAGKEVIYIYHNQIDARGDSLITEDEVFIACEEAMDEIEEMIKKLTNNISASRFIITADHGFIYTRSKNRESEKIDRFFESDDKINKRFVISNNKYGLRGIKNIMVSDVLGSYDARVISTPINLNIFKTQGGGQNFYHGGSSPQEIIIPVIKLKTIRGAVDIKDVKISLISSISKITTTDFKTEFVQKDPISDIIKSVSYKIRFTDEYGNLISNEEIYLAKSKSKEIHDRIFKLDFKLKHQEYLRGEKYYFVVTNLETGMDLIKEEVLIDIPFMF